MRMVFDGGLIYIESEMFDGLIRGMVSHENGL